MTKALDDELTPFLNAISGRKVIDPVALNLRDLTSVADIFIILSGRSHRHVAAIAEHIRLALKSDGLMPLQIEGKRQGHWVILDYGHVVIHVFYEPVRAVYDLEGFWADAPRIDTTALSDLSEAGNRSQSIS